MADDTIDGDEQLDQAGDATAAIGRVSGRPDRRATRWGLFAGLALVVVLVDQLTKAWLVSVVAPGDVIEVLGDWLRLVHGRNDGGLFGLFEGSAELFAAASVGVIVVIVAYHARSRPSLVLSTALGLLLGGAIGNLLDRLRYGYVIDFVDAGIGDLRFYTFNAADAAISTSILLLVVLAFVPSSAGGATEGADA